ncbi:MAG: RluA family pseudouridine synthase [Limosilactobacillus gorillae]|uniref:RluA family pseudouridine synthase n=1 Tax=Limosilactobacillus gorillae TaxID=1450649 RepID=UPI000A839A8D|nr:RluA family pseudouridine synthase [Limosilactobacillus gorillae]MDO4856266.1 RluA family pseudouridine synthase [Limosilactobacillus gorillae]
MEYRWQIEERLNLDQEATPLRHLLQRQWLLPKRVVHFLRVRRQVLVNNEYRPVSKAVGAGDVITLNFTGDEFRTPESSYVPEQGPLTVLFENRDLLVVNKPAGIKSHPNREGEVGTLMNLVSGYLMGTTDAAYMVHRLDQETSGAMIVAKNPIVVPILDRLISTREIHRDYLALVAGIPNPKRGIWDLPLGQDPTDVRKRMVNGQNAQAARTHYRTLATNGGRALVVLNLETGRTHQLRVHLAAAGCPIVGDPLYGTQSAPRMYLHGVAQELVVPFSLKRERIVAKIPDDFPQF